MRDFYKAIELAIEDRLISELPSDFHLMVQPYRHPSLTHFEICGPGDSPDDTIQGIYIYIRNEHVAVGLASDLYSRCGNDYDYPFKRHYDRFEYADPQFLPKLIQAVIGRITDWQCFIDIWKEEWEQRETEFAEQVKNG